MPLGNRKSPKERAKRSAVKPARRAAKSTSFWEYDEKFDQLTKPKFDKQLDDRTSVDNMYKLIVALLLLGGIAYVVAVGPDHRWDESNRP